MIDRKEGCNLDTFREEWRYGAPVIASKQHPPSLQQWTPTAFNKDAGHQPALNALVNCRMGTVIQNATLADFWVGFESIKGKCDK